MAVFVYVPVGTGQICKLGVAEQLRFAEGQSLPYNRGGGQKGRRGVKLPRILAVACEAWQFDTPQSASLTAPLL